MKYNFDEIVSRNQTDSIKYDGALAVFGRDDIIPMWIADMDFRTPPYILDAIRVRLDRDVLGYTLKSPQWRASIQQWLQSQHNWRVEEDEIGYVSGIVPAIAFAIQCFTDKSDNILIQPPVYHPYFLIPKGLERNIITNPLKLIDGQYEIDFEHFSEVIKESKLFLLCHPHNPGGRVWKREELEKLAQICSENNVLVISDEIHADMIFKGYRHIPFASVSDAARNNSITMMAISKTFNAAGLMSSYYIAPNEEIHQKYSHFLELSELENAPIFATQAVVAAYSNGTEWLDQMMDYIEENVEYLKEYLSSNMPKIEVIIPQASYLVFLDCRKLELIQSQLVDFFLHEARLGLNNGVAYGKEGEGFMRMNLGCSRLILQKALEQLKQAYDRLIIK